MGKIRCTGQFSLAVIYTVAWRRHRSVPGDFVEEG